MARRDIGIRYPSAGEESRAGEDSHFGRLILERGQEKVALLTGVGYMHVYSHHGDNQVYDLEHHFHISEYRCQPRAEVIKFRSQICDTIDYLRLPGDIRVMCRDGLVFMHRSRHANPQD